MLKDDLPPLDGAILRDAVVLLAKLYYSADMRDKAEHALEHMLKTYPQHIDATVVNILIELKIEFRKYSEVLEIVERSRAKYFRARRLWTAAFGHFRKTRSMFALRRTNGRRHGAH